MADIHAALMAFHFINLLPNMLAPIAGMDVDETIVAFALAQAGWDSAAMSQALTTPIVNGVPTQPADLQPLAYACVRFGTSCRDLQQFGNGDCRLLVRGSIPVDLRYSGFRALRVSDLDAIRRYRQLRSSSTLDAAEVQNLLWQYQVRANGNQAIAPAPLFGSSASLVPIFRDALRSPDHAAFDARRRAFVRVRSAGAQPAQRGRNRSLGEWQQPRRDAFALDFSVRRHCPPTRSSEWHVRFSSMPFASHLGSRDMSLAKLLPADFAGLNSAADWLLGVLKNKYPDQTARDKNILPHTEALNVLRRDALCDYIIARAICSISRATTTFTPIS